MAEKELGTKEIRLNRVIFYTPFDVWFEFVSSEEVIYVSPFTFQAFRKDEIFSVPPLEISKEQSEKAEQEWLRVERGEKLYPTVDQFRIPGVPDFDWSYGCSPTASADVLGYWDANGYPLLIDYYFWRWDDIEGEWDYIPNVQQQLAIAMFTDTTTGGTSFNNILTGTRAVCNDPYWGNNYNFVVENVDDNLPRLLCELKWLHPAHWCLDAHPTYGWHSVCAMGWGPPDTMWICIHDTWSGTPTEVVIQYNWGGGGRHVIPIMPPVSFSEFDRFSPDATVTMAWGDYDKDGYQDIAVSSVDPYSGIYRNNHDGTFTKTTTVWGWGFAWGDYDNDGDLDLAVSKSYGLDNKLFINNGDGTFTETAQFGSSWHGYDIEWADCDNDGDLDAAVTNAGFYRNNGNGTFSRMGSDVLSADDLDWGDYDNDGDPDLALAIYHGSSPSNILLKNNGNWNFEALDEFGTLLACALEWGDYNNDGDLDAVLGTYLRPNKLYRNNGNGTFTELSPFVGNEWTMDLAWGDYDHDGDLDLAAANFAWEDDGAPKVLYANNGDGTFTRVELCGLEQDGYQSCWADYDNDGDLDLAYGIYNGKDKLYRNNVNNDDYIKVKLVGRRRGSGGNTGYSNRSGIGAKVNVYDEPKVTLFGFREISSEGSAQEAHIAVPAGNTYDVEVYWPTSRIIMDTLVTAPAVITVWEYCRGDANGDKVVNSSDIVFLVNYLFKGGPPPDPWMAGDANADGYLNSSDVVYLTNYLYKGGPAPPPPNCP